jgi:hypothetical protein
LKKNNKNSEETNTSSKDLNQLMLELEWDSRSLLSSYLAFYGTILVIILRLASRIKLIDEINGTNFAESTIISGMTANNIIETYPLYIDGLFLILTINSVESSYEQLINKQNTPFFTEGDIRQNQKGLEASFFAYMAAKITREIDSATEFF